MTTFTPKREYLAWAAGFFDGEGCTSLAKGVVRLSINQNDPEVLHRFRAAVGVGKVSGPYGGTGTQKDGSPSNPYWKYSTWSFEEIQAVVVMIWPWLGSLKREQAIRRLSEAHKPRRLKGRTTCNRGHAYEGNRTKHGQCRPCMNLSDRRRRGAVT